MNELICQTKCPPNVPLIRYTFTVETIFINQKHVCTYYGYNVTVSMNAKQPKPTGIDKQHDTMHTVRTQVYPSIVFSKMNTIMLHLVVMMYVATQNRNTTKKILFVCQRYLLDILDTYYPDVFSFQYCLSSFVKEMSTDEIMKIT